MNEIDALPVPDFNFSAIERRAQSVRPAPKRGRVLSLVALSVLVPALAAAAVVQFWPVHMVQHDNVVEFSAKRVRAQFRATPAHLHDLASAASYRLTLPTGLPAGNTLHTAVLIGSQVLVVNYGSRSGFARFIISPVHMRSGPKTNDLAGIRFRLTPLQRNYNWNVHGEHVMLGTNYLTNDQVARIRAAMFKAGTDQGQR